MLVAHTIGLSREISPAAAAAPLETVSSPVQLQSRRLSPVEDHLNNFRHEQGQPQGETPLDLAHGGNETFVVVAI